MPRAVVLFSGGLDSILAVRILQEQGFDIDALCIRTFYSSCRSAAEETAAALGVRLTVLPVGEDYVEVIRNPLYGYGKGANPCVDCRIYMCRMAGRLMEELGACAVVTGELVGQRPMSQKRQHLEVIARRSGLEGRLLRPLSAKLLPPTIPEQELLVDRRRLYDFSGRGRRGLIALAESLGISKIPTPSSGCTLTEPSFAGRVRDLLQFCPDAARWDFELLNHGRHFRFDEQTKIVIGRSATDNDALRSMATREDAPEMEMLIPDDFRGPGAVVVGYIGEPALAFAGALMLRYAGPVELDEAEVRVDAPETGWVIRVKRDTEAESATSL